MGIYCPKLSYVLSDTTRIYLVNHKIMLKRFISCRKHILCKVSKQLQEVLCPRGTPSFIHFVTCLRHFLQNWTTLTQTMCTWHAEIMVHKLLSLHHHCEIAFLHITVFYDTHSQISSSHPFAFMSHVGIIIRCVFY